MNKVLIVGRLVRDPETNQTGSGIKYTRFTVAVDRQYGENQADFIPMVAWRNQADFIDKYLNKGSLVSVEGRFTSSTYQNNDNQNITRYEVTVDNVQGLESKAQQERRNANPSSTQTSAPAKAMSFEADAKPEVKEETNQKENDVPWELDL